MRVILLFLILMIVGCSNQNKAENNAKSKTELEKYDELIWSAMLNYKDKHFENSLCDFLDAFEIKTDENVSDYFYASAAALNLNKSKLAKKLIVDAITKTNASITYFLNFNEFDKFRNNDIFQEIDTDYQKYKSQYISNLKYPKIQREIDSLYEIDQEMRNNGSEWKEIARVDSLNIKRLIEITKEYGWQKKGWIILWHQRGTYGEENYVWNFFKPYINEQIAKGEMRKSYWSNFEEEKSIRENNVQIYGLFSGNFDRFPIKDISKVDSLRETIGKPNLLFQSKVYDMELPKDYAEKLPLTTYKNNRAISCFTKD